MRRPSEKLTTLLTDLQVCSREEIASCETHVRRLCHDLPDFDSVWLDVLAQHRFLTPWQSTVLQSAKPEQLRVEEFIKRDALGNTTYLASSTTTNRLVTLQQIQVPSETNRDRQSQRMFGLLERLNEIRHDAPAGVELPQRVVDDPETALFFASSYVPGWGADALLIRGGRMPWPVVAEIGLQLLAGLEWMERHGLSHGDVSFRNVRLRPDGRATLVAPLIHEFTKPARSFTAKLQLRDVETAAPELFGTGARVDSRSDMYSLGCVLWQLLTARSPFLTTDAVGKVLKSQETDVPDVRTLVPDCPAWLGRSIHSFTRRIPELRPQSLTEITEQWRIHCDGRPHHSRRLIRRMPDHSQRLNPLGISPNGLAQRLAPVAAAVLMVCSFAAYGISSGLLPQPLMLGGIAEPIQPSIQTSRLPTYSDAEAHAVASESDAEEAVSNGPRQLPDPDAAGVVVLESGKVYSASQLVFAGVLHVETTDAELAVVVVENGATWKLAAKQIVLTNVQIETTEEESAAAGSAMVECRCDVLSINRCIFGTLSSTRPEDCMIWIPESSLTSVVSVVDSVFSGSGYGIWLKRPPNRCRLDNTLMVMSGVAARFDVPSSNDATVRLDLNRICGFGGRGIVDVVVADAAVDDLRVEISCGESVLAPSSSIVRIAGPIDWPRSNASVEFLLPERGNATIVPPDVHPATFLDRSLGTLVALDPGQLIVESLLIATPVFRGGAVRSAEKKTVADFELIDYEGPKLSSQLPGVAIDRLPTRTLPNHL